MDDQNLFNNSATPDSTTNNVGEGENKEFDVVENNSWDTSGSFQSTNPNPVPAPNPEPVPQPAPQPIPQPAPQPIPQPGPMPNQMPNMNGAPNMGPMPNLGPGPNMQPVPPMSYPNQPYAPGAFPQSEEMTVKDWMLTLFLSFIPIAGLILQIVWAAESNPTKKARKNWAIASLIWRVILYVLGVVLSYAVFALVYELFDLFF